jgi:hypothetical protein
MPTTQPPPPKKEVALALLERSSVYVHLDPRREAVVVPVWLKKQPQLVLQVGLNMHVPIPDLNLDDDGMSCTLSFNRAPFYCVVPWSSVFAMVGDDGRGVVWPDDVPAEVARQAHVKAVDGPQEPKEQAAPRAAAALAPAQEDGRTAPSPEPARTLKSAKADATKPKRPRKRPALAAVDSSSPASPEPARALDGRSPASPEPARNLRTVDAPAPKRPSKPARVAETAEKEDVATAPVAAPVQVARPTLGTAKKKRELPPYLRVVK